MNSSLLFPFVFISLLMNTVKTDIWFSRSDTLISKSSMLLLLIPWFLFLLIHVIAVAGTMIELSFCVILRLESLIKVQHAMTGSKKTLIKRSPIIPITVRMTQSGTKCIRLIGHGKKAF